MLKNMKYIDSYFKLYSIYCIYSYILVFTQEIKWLTNYSGGNTLELIDEVYFLIALQFVNASMFFMKGWFI